VKACQFGHGSFGASNLITFGLADKTIPLFAFDYLTFPLLESEISVIKIVQIRAAFFRLHHPGKKVRQHLLSRTDSITDNFRFKISLINQLFSWRV
jgi:hypothetical protein